MSIPSADADLAASALVVRAAGLHDRAALTAFIAQLSVQSRYLRFLHPIRVLPGALMDTLLRFEPTAAVALLAFTADAANELVGVAQYAASGHDRQCEIGVVVADAWQRRGIASLLLRELARIARFGGFRVAVATAFSNNHGAIKLARKWHGRIGQEPGNPQLTSICVRLDDAATLRCLARPCDEPRSPAPTAGDASSTSAACHCDNTVNPPRATGQELESYLALWHLLSSDRPAHCRALRASGIGAGRWSVIPAHLR